ncbi:MAG: hypothetical protein IRY85_12810 [Micromonosporaceae bacterium]|nr:hypothetical protein [Micromonosporaceae bacterium]
MRAIDDGTARQIVWRHADEVLELAGWAGFASGDSQPVPCRGPDGRDEDNVYYTEGSFQLIVPLEQHRALVDRVARGWATRGYTVDPVTAFPDGGARVSARAGFVDLTLGSGQAPAMVLVVVTDCYRVAGEPP